MKWRVILGTAMLIFATESWGESVAYQSWVHEREATIINNEFLQLHDFQFESLSSHPEDIVVQQRGPREFELTLRYNSGLDDVERLDRLQSLRRQLYITGQLEGSSQAGPHGYRTE